jgi:hypothetical protein
MNKKTWLMLGAGIVGGLIVKFSGNIFPASTVGGGAPNNTKIPWYVTPALVLVGGVLAFKYGRKLLKV